MDADGGGFTGKNNYLESYIHNAHLLHSEEKEDHRYKKFYNFVFDLYVVWLLVFWRNVLNVSNFLYKKM